MSNMPKEKRRGCNPVGCLGSLLAYSIVFVGGFIAGISMEVISDHEFGGSAGTVERQKRNSKMESNSEPETIPDKPKGLSGNYLGSPGLEEVTVCGTKANAERLAQLIVAEDKLGVVGMIADGRAWQEKTGTKITVIDINAFGPSEVRLLEGKNAGRTIWIRGEYIQYR